jgi:hypothetical protein
VIGIVHVDPKLLRCALASRFRNGAAAENYSFLRKFVISLLKRDTSPGSLKGKRKRAAWNTDFLEKLLFPSDEDAMAVGS